MQQTNFAILRKAGKLANGWESGKGTIWHAVPVDNHGTLPALCGAVPAISWAGSADAVTCPRCLRKLEKDANHGNANA